MSRIETRLAVPSRHKRAVRVQRLEWGYLSLTCLLCGCLTPDAQYRDEFDEAGAGGADTAGSGGLPEEGEPGSGGDASGGAGSGAESGSGGGSTGDGGTADGSGGDGSGGDGSGGDGSGGDGSGGDGSGGAPSTSCYGTLPLLFTDDFEVDASCWAQNTTGDWQLLPTAGYSGTQGFEQGSSRGFRVLAIAGEPTWDNVRVQAYIKVLDWGDGVLQDQVALIARYQNENDFYYVSMSAMGSEQKLRLKKSVSGLSSQIGSSYILSGGWELDTWYQIAIEVNGSNLRGFINGVPRLDDHMDTEFAAGQIGIGTMQDATIVVDDVTVTQL